ncbi:DUF3299 domain-containing protein [Sphingomonas bacterium]|uniref:DUF3299 domain-containing protein n=1 Tax=Sphingomonas bacterium TaxID=1895847 RepID=UPI0020C68A78|nr:DUF3299 domain-containing protein [Sphingomonas bacterium]
MVMRIGDTLRRAMLLLAVAASGAVAQTAGMPGVKDIWQPAPTPAGGLSWALLESTRVIDRRDAHAMVFSRPGFPATVAALAGRRVIVAGYMMPLDPTAGQKHFVLLGYPPGCPYHLHAMPNQFVEVYAARPIPLDETNRTVIAGTLRLTGQDESGIFYRLDDARRG